MKFEVPKNEEDYQYHLRKFQLDELLKQINIESAELFANFRSADISGTNLTSFSFVEVHTGIRHEQPVYITGWNLIDLAYYAIKYTHDYRGKTILKDELKTLVSFTEAINAMREADRFDKEKLGRNPYFFIYLWGFFGEQQKIQLPGKVFENLSRELYILFELAPQIGSVIDANKIVEHEVGLCAHRFVLALFLAWLVSIRYPTQADWEQKLIWSEILSLEDFRKVISRFTANYGDVRDSDFGRQFLYTKPFIKTQKREVISINCYLNFFLVEHSVLWCIRDHYLRKDDRGFTSEFGVLFEAYFEELLTTVLNRTEYEKIPEEEKERADWKIVTGKHKFLIEQKSALLGLKAKQQDSNIDTTILYCKRNLIKAISQLEETEKDFGDGPYIKIILLYDDYLSTGLLDHVFALPECKRENDGYYWLANIDEIESLLFLQKHNEKLADEIIDEIIKRKITRSNEGKSISHLLQEKGIRKNPYISQPKFIKYIERLKCDSRAILDN